MNEVNIKLFLDNLTDKQLNVLSCLALNLSYKATGKILKVSDRTIEGRVREIVKKSTYSSKDKIIRYLRLPENEIYFKKLEDRYNHLISESTFQAKRKIPWRIYISIFTIVLSLCVIIYYISNAGVETSLQSIGNSTCILQRQNIIKQMTSCKNRVIILTGQGGAGKTTVARKYTRDQNTVIKYEINAESKNSIKSELMGLAGVLAKTPKDIETKNIIESISDEDEKLRRLSIFLQQKLKAEKNWCLLLDNLDNLNAFSSMYLDNLFSLNNGTIIITTRNKNISSYFADAKIISIGILGEDEKMELFCKITGFPLSKAIEENLLMIPSYPLDVSCCAYYTHFNLPIHIG